MNERGELTLGNMAVHGVDDDSNLWRGHFLDSELGEKMLERTLGRENIYTESALALDCVNAPTGWLILSLMTETSIIFSIFHPRSDCKGF